MEVLLVELKNVSVKLVVDESQIFLMLLKVNQSHFDRVLPTNRALDKRCYSVLEIGDSSSEHQDLDKESIVAYIGIPQHYSMFYYTCHLKNPIDENCLH